MSRRSPRAKRPKCPRCKGHGFIPEPHYALGTFFPPTHKRKPCPDCAGAKRVTHATASGAGHFSKRQKQLRAAFGLDPDAMKGETNA